MTLVSLSAAGPEAGALHGAQPEQAPGGDGAGHQDLREGLPGGARRRPPHRRVRIYYCWPLCMHAPPMRMLAPACCQHMLLALCRPSAPMPACPHAACSRTRPVLYGMLQCADMQHSNVKATGWCRARMDLAVASIEQWKVRFNAVLACPRFVRTMDGPFFMRERVEGSPTKAMPVGLVRPFTVRSPA